MGDQLVVPVRAPSPRFTARLAGAFYLLNIATGAAALFLSGPPGSAVLLIAAASYVGVTVLFYQLFRPVNPRLSAVAAGFSLIGCAISALTALHVASIGLNPLVFFGCYCLLIGYLIIRSTFLPASSADCWLWVGWAGSHFSPPPCREASFRTTWPQAF